MSGGAKPSFVAWLEFGFGGFLCGSFSALGSSKHGIPRRRPRRGASKQKAPNASVQNRTPRKTRKKSPAEAGLETGMKVSGKRAFLPSHQLTEAVSVPTRRSLDRCDGARRSRLPLDVGLARRPIVASGRLAIGKEKAPPKRGRIYLELSFSASPDVTSRIKSAKRGNVEPRCRAS